MNFKDLRFVAIAFVGLLVAPMSASAAPPPPQICSALSNAIDTAEKDLSGFASDMILEDSAPRASVLAGRMTANYAAIQANILLMEAHHCSPYPYAITDVAFFLNATECKTATLNHSITGNPGVPDECDRSKWTRAPGK